MISSFEDLEVWQKAHALTLSIYRITRSFPQDEKFGLISQLRRSGVSIENNIAEGTGRRTTKDYISFLHYAFGSLRETQSSLKISFDLQYLGSQDFLELKKLSTDVILMLNKLIAVLSSKGIH